MFDPAFRRRDDSRSWTCNL